MDDTRDVADMDTLARRLKAAGPAPVHLWNPPFCGDLDMRIAADGTWRYMGTPIARARLVRLFASVLRRDEDGRFYLVTPVEKIGIRVDDAPFLAVSMEVSGDGVDQKLNLTTNVGDKIAAGPDHALRFAVEAETGGLKPYIHVRGRLEALVSRAVMHELADLVRTHELTGKPHYGVWSGGVFFSISPQNQIGNGY